jgi:hypothetical protein
LNAGAICFASKHSEAVPNPSRATARREVRASPASRTKIQSIFQDLNAGAICFASKHSEAVPNPSRATARREVRASPASRTKIQSIFQDLNAGETPKSQYEYHLRRQFNTRHR